MVLQYTAALILLGLGGLLATVNARNFLRQLMGKPAPSIAPLVGGGMLFIGGRVFPDPTVQSYAWVGLFLDCGCILYFAGASFSLWQESRRYSSKNKLLWLSYETQTMKGDISVYPEDECIFKYAMNDKQSYGSYVMKVARYIDGKTLEIETQGLELSLARENEAWAIVAEEGWNDPRMSLAGARTSEQPLSRRGAS